MESGLTTGDVALLDRNNGYGYNNGFGEGGWFMWIFALLLLPGLFGGGFWGNNARGEVVTESALCNAMNFNNLENQVGRLGDRQLEQFTSLTNGICNLGYEQLRNTNQTQMQAAQIGNETQRQIAECLNNLKKFVKKLFTNKAAGTCTV